MNEVRLMSYDQLGAIADPMALMATGSTASLTLRYLVRTGQLERRFPGQALPELLHVMAHAAPLVQARWTFDVMQKLPQGVQDDDVDAYLDELAIEIENIS
jgi:hypothetical protein